jgi:hypothetical protein
MKCRMAPSVNAVRDDLISTSDLFSPAIFEMSRITTILLKITASEFPPALKTTSLGSGEPMSTNCKTFLARVALSSTFHRITSLTDTEAKRELSGEKARAQTRDVCPLKMVRCIPFSPSQTKTRVLFLSYAAMYSPFEENLILVNEEPSVSLGGFADSASLVVSQT